MPRRPALLSMSIEDLVRLRGQIAKALSQQASTIRAQLTALGGNERSGRSASRLAGRKVPPKYRDKSGNTWSGRGAQPRWMTTAINAGAKREDFLIVKPANSVKRARPAKRAKSAKRRKSAKRLSSSKRQNSAKRSKFRKRPRPVRRLKSTKRLRYAKRPSSATR